MAAQQNKRVVLSKMLRDLLGQPVSVKNLSKAEIDNLVEGHQVMSNGEALAQKLMEMAVQGKEWAISLVLERTEGKAVQATKEDGSDRTTEERLNNITAKHLNSLTAAYVADPQPEADPAAAAPVADGADRPASRLLGLPRNRPNRPKEA